MEILIAGILFLLVVAINREPRDDIEELLLYLGIAGSFCCTAFIFVYYLTFLWQVIDAVITVLTA